MTESDTPALEPDALTRFALRQMGESRGLEILVTSLIARQAHMMPDPENAALTIFAPLRSALEAGEWDGYGLQIIAAMEALADRLEGAVFERFSQG